MHLEKERTKFISTIQEKYGLGETEAKDVKDISSVELSDKSSVTDIYMDGEISDVKWITKFDEDIFENENSQGREYDWFI